MISIFLHVLSPFPHLNSSHPEGGVTHSLQKGFAGEVPGLSPQWLQV